MESKTFEGPLNGKVPATGSPQTGKQLYKVFQCRTCLQRFLVPLSSGVNIECEHDRFSTGSIKDLVDIIEK